MAETGWPLIPREVLPAPVPPAVRAARREKTSPVDAGRQLSIFGAETTEPSPFDLAALLAGPGRLERMGGTARVSVRVDAAWRVHVLVAELVGRGLVVNWRPFEDQTPEVRAAEPPETADAEAAQRGDSANPDGVAEPPPAVEETNATADGEGDPGEEIGAKVSFEVRTAYSSRLKALANAWPQAADQLFLSGPRLRLWVAAAGRPTPGGYALGLDPDYSASNKERTGDALRRAGLEGILDNGGGHYLIMGRRRLARLAELVGERPAAAPAELWPGGATA
jgi:hypothetical protein